MLERKNAGTKMTNDTKEHVAISFEKRSKIKAFVPILDGITFVVTMHEGFFSDDEEEDVPPAKTEETHVADDKVNASAELKEGIHDLVWRRNFRKPI
jgi:hypothetical protein